VRIAEGQTNKAATKTNSDSPSSGSGDLTYRGGTSTGLNGEEQKLLDWIGEALARLSRVKRVGLTLEDKAAFVKAWSGKRA
jgi:hypothetical protein